jgi:hypothetical protein
MNLNFIFSHLNAIILIIWIIFLFFIAIRFFKPAWVKDISFLKLALIAFAINIFYGLFITWGQYHVWAVSKDMTHALINLPLPGNVPFPPYLEWIRPLFENHLGYFLYYVLGRVWFNVFISFIISGVLYLIFKAWDFYRGGFLDQGPELLLALMLVPGWPEILIFIPLGFFLSILVSCFSHFRGNKVVNIELSFIFAALLTLLFARIILSYL